MKTVFEFVLCCAYFYSHSQFRPRKSSPKVYTVEEVKLPVYKTQYLMTVNTSAQKSLLVQPQRHYVPNLAVTTGSSSLGSAYSYTTKRGNTVVYTFNQMGNYNGSTILFKEKEQKKKSSKKKFRY